MDDLLSSIKERHRLISKGMSNTYLKVNIDKNWRPKKFIFPSLKQLSESQFLVSHNSGRFYLVSKLRLVT